MLRPNKHSHPDLTTIAVSLHLLTHVRLVRLARYEELLTFAKKKSPSGEFLFRASLNFLYLLGLIEYHSKTDSIEYVGPNETL